MRNIGALAVALVLAHAGVSKAHPITLDGSDADWIATAPIGFNVARVQRDASGRGEWIWVDEDDDARTDLAGGGAEDADLREVRVTATATTLTFLVRMDGVGTEAQDAQVQIALDLDRTDASGNEFFAGFADLTASSAARWEYLLRTRDFASASPSVELLDASYAPVAGAGSLAADGAGLVEISVDWADLGLAGAPSAFRFSVATFRESATDGNTVGLGDASVSNALDLLTDYDDRINQSTGTWPGEISMGDIELSHFAEVWMSAEGEVIAPVVVTRFLSDAAMRTELIEIANAAGAAVGLAGFKVGDEEQPDAGEGMRVLPDTTLDAGAALVIASATPFTASFGAAPDIDLASLVVFDAWGGASGSVALSNAGDEVLVLGVDNTVLDAVSYGSGAYPGVTVLGSAPGDDEVAVRLVDTVDTDDMTSDFALFDACDEDADCGPCFECTRYACLPRPMGASCGDGDACNGDETCDGAGSCEPGIALECDDSNLCTADSCDATLGCQNMPLTGTSCADGDVCNGDEVCDAGTCVAGTALDCDDANACTADSCDATMGCQNDPLTGTACPDGDLCNGDEICNAGTCEAGTALDCDDSNVCTEDSCEAAAGCMNAPLSGTACLDADVCNGSEMCMDGVCAAGTSLDCDDSNPCTADSCDAITGCANDPLSGTSCGDGDVCNGAEMCMDGTCASGTPLDCDDMDPCTIDSCDAVDGCAHEPDPACADAGVDAGPMDEDAGVDAGPMDEDAGVDAGPMDEDAGVDAGPMDAGTDAGPMDEDAGMMAMDASVEDAGAEEDAGRDASVEEDASMPEEDAGRADAGMPFDEGDDGCGCRVAPPRSDARGLAFLAVGALLFWRRRR